MGNSMTPRTEVATCQGRVVESHVRSDAVWNHNLSAVFAIKFHFDQPVRGRDASFKMPERAELRRDFGARVARRCWPHPENPSG